MMKTAVVGDQVRVQRGGVVVLRDLDVEVPAGSITGLLGPSGCGKTTLLRSVVGVQRLTAGSLQVLGRPAGARELRRQIGYVTQSPNVYDDLTVAENLRFFARVLGVGAGRVETCLRTVALLGLRDRVVARLSGGERSRTSLAVALLGQPPLLVLDEPTVGLDPVLRGELWATFRELAQQGAAVLVSSHVMDEARRCDRLLLMREGRLLAAEAPETLLRRTGATDVEAAFVSLVHSAGAPA